MTRMLWHGPQWARYQGMEGSDLAKRDRLEWLAGLVFALGAFLTSTVVEHAVAHHVLGHPGTGDPGLAVQAGLLLIAVAATLLAYGWFKSLTSKMTFTAALKTVLPWWVLAGGIGLHGAGSQSLELIDELPHSWIWVAVFVIYIAILMMATFKLTALVHHHAPEYRNEIKSSGAPRRTRHLIVFLSLLRGMDATRGQLSKLVDFEGSLKEYLDIVEAAKDWTPRVQWSWQPLLRGIQHHAIVDGANLTLTVIGSRLATERGSVQQIDWLKDILSRIPETAAVTIQAWGLNSEKPIPGSALATIDAGQGLDFEEIIEQQRVLRRLLKYLANQGVPAAEVTVDVTGGQKPTSIVAALASCNTENQAQYIQTNGTYDAIGYDIHFNPDLPGAL